MKKRVLLFSLLTFFTFFDNVYAGYKEYNDADVSLDDNVVIVPFDAGLGDAVTFADSIYCPNSWQDSNYACFKGKNTDNTYNIWKAPRFTFSGSDVNLDLNNNGYGFFLPIYVDSIDNISEQKLTIDNFTYTGQEYVVYYYLSSYNFWNTDGNWKNTSKSLANSRCYFNGYGYAVNKFSSYNSVSNCERIVFKSYLTAITKDLKYDKENIESIKLVKYAYVYEGNATDSPTRSTVDESDIIVESYKNYDVFKKKNCFSNYCLSDNSISLMNDYGNKTKIGFDAKDTAFSIETTFFKDNPDKGYIRWNDSMIYNMFYFAFKITPKDKLPDKVCTTGEGLINSCESKNLLYNCDKMKIRTKSDNGTILAAYVKLKEYGRFTMNSYAGENVKVLAGQGFPIGMSYIYNLSWEMSDFVCNGVDDKTCYQKLYDKLYDLSFKDVSDEKLQTKLNTYTDTSGVKEKNIFKDETDENLSIAGSWECNGKLNDYSEGETSGGATIICQYKINDAYINFDTGYITYKNKSSENRFKNLGAYFYIPLNYSESTFYWDVISDNISLVNVRTIENNYDFVSNNKWYINTKDNVDDSGNNLSKCFVEVKKGSIGPPGSGSDDGINIVYRSVDTDISNDESTLDSNLKLYYLEEGTNWYNYFYDVKDDGTKSLNRSHFSRIKTTFDNLHYSTKTLTNSKIKSLLKDFDSKNYTNWNNVDSNGISGLISSDYFNVINTGGKIHCKWGEFNKLSCDDYNT